MTALLQKTTTATVDTGAELGQFSAIAAAYTIDRQGERISPGAFSYTIQRWRDSGKDIPIHWDHNRDASAVIGSIDPAAMRERSDGLYVEGSLDIEDSEVAREAVAQREAQQDRAVLRLSRVDEHDANGVKVLDALDVFEVTLTSSPANADARILSTKALGLRFDFGDRPQILNDNWERELERWEKSLYNDTHPIRIKTFEC